MPYSQRPKYWAILEKANERQGCTWTQNMSTMAVTSAQERVSNHCRMNTCPQAPRGPRHCIHCAKGTVNLLELETSGSQEGRCHGCYYENCMVRQPEAGTLLHCITMRELLSNSGIGGSLTLEACCRSNRRFIKRCSTSNFFKISCKFPTNGVAHYLGILEVPTQAQVLLRPLLLLQSAFLLAEVAHARLQVIFAHHFW